MERRNAYSCQAISPDGFSMPRTKRSYDARLKTMTRNPRPGITLLDTAGGTGDIAFRVLDRLESRGHGGEGRVIVCDLTADMLAVGRDRAIDRGLLRGISWGCRCWPSLGLRTPRPPGLSPTGPPLSTTICPAVPA